MKLDNKDEHYATKTSVSNYGIRMISCHGEQIEYLEDFNKCYMILVDNIENARAIPKQYMESECDWYTGVQMPIFDVDDPLTHASLINPDHKLPIVFACVWDEQYEELYWRDITFDYSIIKKIFGV